MTKALLIILLFLPIMPSMAEVSRENGPLSENAPLSLLNEIKYSSHLITAGQPSEEQFRALAEAGFQRVIFLAFTDHKNAVKNEDRIARSAGLEFVHIPVAWDAPTTDDFDTFAAVMRATEKTLVHCEVNFRASVFGFLYQVIYLGTPAEEAWALLTGIWIPNETWETFIVSALAEKGIEHPGV